MHFFNPVPVLQLVEVIRAEETSDETATAIVELARDLGKTPAEARDFPGFVSNRILMPFINEAAYALQDGVAEPEAIDTIARLGFAHPIGPAGARGPDRARHVRGDHGGHARGSRRPEVRALPAAARARRCGTSRSEIRTRLLRVLTMADERLDAELAVQGGTDEAFVEGAFRLRAAQGPGSRGARAGAREARGGDALACDAHPRARDERGVRARAGARRRRRARARRARAGRAHPLAAGAARDGRARRRGAVGDLPPAPGGARARDRLRVRGDRVPRSAAALGRRAGRRGSRDARRERAGDGRGRRARAPVPGRLVRPGAARLDPRARRRGQRALRAGGRARRRSALRGAARAPPCPAGRRQPARDGAPRASPATTAGSGRRTSAAGTASTRASGFFVAEQEAYELTERRLARGARLRRGRRPLRVEGAGGVGRALRRASPGTAPPPVTPGGLWTTARRRARPLRHRRNAGAQQDS